jgi:hypothetical protein
MVQHTPFEMVSKKGRRKVFLVLSTDECGAWEELVERSPLNSRGWAFQERLLAPRNIFFCKGMVLYECCEQRWSESTGLDVVPWNPVAEEYLFSEDIIMLPSTPSIEIMVRGVLRRMILQRGPRKLHVFPVGVVAVPEEQDMEALREREYSSTIGPSFVSAMLDLAVTETDISVLNASGRLFYVPWYDNYWGLPSSYCLLLELVCGEMSRFRRIGLLRFGVGYHNLYLPRQVSEQGYPGWKNEQSTGEDTFFIV